MMTTVIGWLVAGGALGGLLGYLGERKACDS